MNLFSLMPTTSSKEKDKELAKKIKDSKPEVTAKTVQKWEDRIKALKATFIPPEGYDYEIITDIGRFEDYFIAAVKNNIIAIDTETTGLDPLKCQVVGICLYTPGQKPAYAPINHLDKVSVQLPFAQTATILYKYLYGHKLPVIYHHAKFDLRMIKNTFGFPDYFYITPFWDTKIAAFFLNENESHSLKDLYPKYCNKGEKSDKYNELFEGMPFSRVPIDIGAVYASKDAIMTYELYKFQEQFLGGSRCAEKNLEKTYDLYKNTELELIPILCKMEDSGVLFDPDIAIKLEKKYSAELVDIENEVQLFFSSLDYSKLDPEIKEKLSNPINLASPTQLAIVIYDVLKLTSKFSGRSTDEKNLIEFIKQEPLLEPLLKHRELSKLISTYLNKMVELAKFDGRIHTSFNQTGPVTGRFSSSDPNMQNIPSANKDIRKMFVADRGKVFISGDYSQQEPRVLAHVSQDERLIQSYADGKDIYAMMGHLIYKKPYEECRENFPNGTPNPEGKKRRTAMKILVLAKMYGMGDNSVAEKLGVSLKEAQKINEMFHEAIPKIQETYNSSIDHARTKGYVQTEYGRKRRLADLNLPKFSAEYGDDVKVSTVKYYLNELNTAKSFTIKRILKDAKEELPTVKFIDNTWKIAEAERQALNSIIQGTSADITKRAMVALGNNERLAELGYTMLLTVHDEIIGQCPIQYAKEVSQLKSNIMIEVAKPVISVPMKVDIEITDRWYGEAINL